MCRGRRARAAPAPHSGPARRPQGHERARAYELSRAGGIATVEEGMGAGASQGVWRSGKPTRAGGCRARLLGAAPPGAFNSVGVRWAAALRTHRLGGGGAGSRGRWPTRVRVSCARSGGGRQAGGAASSPADAPGRCGCRAAGAGGRAAPQDRNCVTSTGCCACWGACGTAPPCAACCAASCCCCCRRICCSCWARCACCCW